MTHFLCLRSSATRSTMIGDKQQTGGKMSYIVNKNNCIGCQACIDSCPMNVIRFEDGLAFIVADMCIECGSCSDICPYEAIEVFWFIKNLNYN